MDRNQQIELLRRFEPIVRYTRGEQFFPMDAESYIRASSLWIKRAQEEPRELVAAASLTPETLAATAHDEIGSVYYLRFVEPLSATEMAARALRRRRRDLHVDEFSVGTGRLARVGYVSRVVDALYSVALLARGRVPGDTATAAALGYQQLMRQGHRHSYHGRVLTESGWIVLQYWFFYLFNNWRSGFNGANDHEADWEMVCVYLSQDDDERVSPEWVAFASHDYAGDDLRRRWDDPELQKVGEHPVVLAGAGSHASYFSPGEYITEIELSYLTPLTRVAGSLRRAWLWLTRDGGNAGGPGPAGGEANVLAIPFVDYARGDGLSLGPGQDEEWGEPHLIDETVGWVRGFRGLWGLYTRDQFAGEDAPAGPMYNRNGTVRRSWYNPVGWSGLDKVPPAVKLASIVEEQQRAIRARRRELHQSIAEKTDTLRSLEVRAAATLGQPHLDALRAQTQKSIGDLSTEIAAFQAEMTADLTLLESLERFGDQVRQGDLGSARAHIRRAHRPADQMEARVGRLAELWAAVSVTVLLLAFVVVFTFSPSYLPFWLMAIVALFAFVEAGMRGSFTRLVGSVATGLAIVAALVLIYEFFWPLVGISVLTISVYILWDNLRELFGGRGGRRSKRTTLPPE